MVECRESDTELIQLTVDGSFYKVSCKQPVGVCPRVSHNISSPLWLCFSLASGRHRAGDLLLRRPNMTHGQAL